MPNPEVVELERRRTLARVTSAELARRAGSDEAVLSRWRTGDAAPTAAALARYDQALSEIIREQIAALQTLLPEES